MTEKHIDPALQKIKEGAIEYLSKLNLMPKDGCAASLNVVVMDGTVSIKVQARAEEIKL